VSPSGVAVTVTGADNDSLVVEATYYPAQEAETAAGVFAKRAESWLVYYTDDGTDPALATPVVVAMASFDEATAGDVVALQWETDAPMDGAPVRLRIGTRRVDAGPVNRDSALSDEATFTAGLLGPVGPRSKIFTGGGPALYVGPAEGETETVVIDAGEDVRIEVAPGSWSLYADTVLLMRLIWRGTGVAENGVYIPSEWDVSVAAVTPSAGSDDEVFGLGTWDGSNKEVELRVRGQVVAVWDVEQMLLRLHSLQVTGGGVRDLAVAGPTWARWEQSLLNVWDVTLERYLSVWETGTDGATVVLALDGSFSNDSTALVVASVGDEPHVDVAGVWERPTKADEQWRVDILAVEDAVREACRRWQVAEIVVDPFRWARTMQVLADEGLPVVEFPQSPARMVPATQRFYESVINHKITHSGDVSLSRHVGNCVVKVDARGSRVSKETRGSPRKIDLAVAAVMAVDRAASQQDDMTPSIWII
jgi:hypothetical protein